MAIAQCVAHDANWLFSSIKVMHLHYFDTIIRLYRVKELPCLQL